MARSATSFHDNPASNQPEDDVTRMLESVGYSTSRTRRWTSTSTVGASCKNDGAVSTRSPDVTDRSAIVRPRDLNRDQSELDRGSSTRGPRWSPVLVAAVAAVMMAMANARGIVATVTIFADWFSREGHKLLLKYDELAPTTTALPIHQEGIPSRQESSRNKRRTNTGPAHDFGGNKNTPEILTQSAKSVSVNLMTKSHSTSASSIKFMTVFGKTNLERFLQDRPELQAPFDTLQKHHWVYGTNNQPEVFYVPIPREGRERDYWGLVKSGAFERLNLIEIRVPPTWTKDGLERHVRQWAANTMEVSSHDIEQWSSVRTFEDAQANNACKIDVNRVCLIITTNWTPEAFADFNLWNRKDR